MVIQSDVWRRISDPSLTVAQSEVGSGTLAALPSDAINVQRWNAIRIRCAANGSSGSASDAGTIKVQVVGITREDKLGSDSLVTWHSTLLNRADFQFSPGTITGTATTSIPATWYFSNTVANGTSAYLGTYTTTGSIFGFTSTSQVEGASGNGVPASLLLSALAGHHFLTIRTTSVAGGDPAFTAWNVWYQRLRVGPPTSAGE